MAKAKQMARHKSWRCETHDFKTKSPRWWGEHLKKMHVVVKGIPGKPVESAMLKMVESVDLKPTPLMQARAQAAAAQKETASAVRKQGYEEFKFDEEDPRESHLPAARREIQDRIAALRKRVVDLEALDKAIGQVMPS